MKVQGVVGWCEGVVYLMSPGRPTDIGLQLGKACYPCSRLGYRGNVFISSVSSLSFLFLFLPCSSLSSLRLSLLSLFSLSLGDDTKWPTRVDVSLNPNTWRYSNTWRSYAVHMVNNGHFDSQGDKTLLLFIRSGPFSNSSEILSISLIFTSFMKIQQKNNEATLFKTSIMAIFDN